MLIKDVDESFFLSKFMEQRIEWEAYMKTENFVSMSLPETVYETPEARELFSLAASSSAFSYYFSFSVALVAGLSSVVVGAVLGTARAFFELLEYGYLD